VSALALSSKSNSRCQRDAEAVLLMHPRCSDVLAGQ